MSKKLNVEILLHDSIVSDLDTLLTMMVIRRDNELDAEKKNRYRRITRKLDEALNALRTTKGWLDD